MISALAIIVFVVLLSVGLPCLAVLALFGVRFFSFRVVPTIEPPSIVRPREPIGEVVWGSIRQRHNGEQEIR